MEFSEKLQKLRKRKGLTQQELAVQLYVSRTAVSKWESGRGYPNLDSLKEIARFFAVTVDELLSPDDVISVSEKKQKQPEMHCSDPVFGLLDLSMFLFLFIPLFAEKNGSTVRAVSLVMLGDAPLYLKIAYFAVVLGMTVTGILNFALQNCAAGVRTKNKTVISLVFSVMAVLLFVISLQPYAAVVSFALLAFKTMMMLKRG